MAYRTRVNGIQIFGNNDYYEEWADFLKSKGIEIDEDGCYDGEIDDVMEMFEVIDKITRSFYFIKDFIQLKQLQRKEEIDEI